MMSRVRTSSSYDFVRQGQQQQRRRRSQQGCCLFRAMKKLIFHFLLLTITTTITITTRRNGSIVSNVVYATDNDNNQNNNIDGLQFIENGKQLFDKKQYDDAAMEYWKAILVHNNNPNSYNVQTIFQLFIQCYQIQNKMADGFAFVAAESYKRGQSDMGKVYLQQTMQMDPNNRIAKEIIDEYEININDIMIGTTTTTTTTTGSSTSQQKQQQQKKTKDDNRDVSRSSTNDDDEFIGKTPEQLYEIASQHFSNKNYEECADIFEISCQRSGKTLGPSCANAVYCRGLITDWGYNGTRHTLDMQRIIILTMNEVKLNRISLNNNTDSDTSSLKGQNNKNNQFMWNRATSVHPHMMLGYPIDPILKRYSAESASYLDERMARAITLGDGQQVQLPPLPPDLPYDIDIIRQNCLKEVNNNKRNNQQQFRIRVGFVGSGFNSKAVLYLSQDMFRFFNISLFEIHIFSFGPPDNPLFIQHGMRNVDWRKRVQSNVDYFHDCQAMKMDHIKAARFIHEQKIHILIEWDGFARQGERAQGLFALRPAPIQILHQEYLGTSGALYTDYLFTDLITSPPQYEQLYTEKLIWMPNHFFSKGHAYQMEVKKPTYEYKPKQTPYIFGTGTPQENRCLAPNNVGPNTISFVYCSFNKLLKANPDTVRSWIRILREVPNSILCLLDNPQTAIPYFRKFIHEAAGTSSSSASDDKDPESFVPGDGDELNSRIHFLPWEKNPFDHQARNQDFCNIMLDSHPYNGHTVAQDALYGGVPIVTRSNGIDMSSRVTTSANVVLGLQQLNAYDGPRQYEDIAIRIGNNNTEYAEIRNKLIDSCLQRNPMHPYWDVARYVKNFEVGLKIAWDNFLEGKEPDHITIVESAEAAKGTYDEEILLNPPEGKKLRKSGKITSDEL